MLEQFTKNCCPWEGPVLDKFVKDRLPWEGPHAVAEEKHEDEGAAEMCNELTAIPILCPFALLGGRR